MNYVHMGRTGLEVSSLALGTMTFGGWSDAATSEAVYRRCREAGITLFDCADVYNDGEAERLLGGFIADERDEVVVTTKAYFPTGPGRNARGSSRYHLVRAVEASLRRLGTDRIDVFFLHRFDDATALDETLRAVEDLVGSGKILYPAVSNFSAWQTMKALGLAARDGLAPIVAAQPMYNLLKRQAEVEILPLAASEGIAVFPYSPIAGGLLSGKYGVDRRPPSGRVVDNPMYATRYGAAWNYEAAEALTGLARELEVHPVSLAIAWVAAHPSVTAPLIGARSLEQLEPALAALDVPMTPALYAQISQLSPAPAPATDRNEEASSANYSGLLTSAREPGSRR